MHNAPHDAPRSEHFAQTRCSLVAAARDGHDAYARRCLAELCTLYWYPVYAYIRRYGHTSMLAYDLAEAFFNDLIGELRRADPRSHGRFRAFLLARLARFLTEDRRQERPAIEHLISAPLSAGELEARCAPVGLRQLWPQPQRRDRLALAAGSRLAAARQLCRGLPRTAGFRTVFPHQRWLRRHRR